MKKIIIIILLATTISGFAQNSDKEYYFSTNLISPLSGMNLKSTMANVLLPLVSNLEYGFTLSGGYFMKSYNIEIRVTAGRSNPYNFIPQFQLGYNFYPIKFFKNNTNGFYIGSFYRWWDYHNISTNNDLHNMSLNFTTGYFWHKKNIIVDFRVNQSILLYSSSVVENYSGSSFGINTSAMPNLSPVLPFLSINLGWKF